MDNSRYFTSLSLSLGAIRDYEIQTDSKFVYTKRTKNFGKEWTPESTDHLRVWFSGKTKLLPEEDAYPYLIIGHCVKQCVSELRSKTVRNTQKEKETVEDHVCARNSRRSGKQSTKKLGCKSLIRIQEIICFSEFTVNSHRQQKNASCAIKYAIRTQSLSSLTCIRVFVVLFPDASSQKNHAIGDNVLKEVGNLKHRKMGPVRPRRKSDRMACKQCPACEDQVPVACKYCPCGHQFPTRNKAKQKALRNESSSKEDGGDADSAPVGSEQTTDSASKDGTEIGTKRRTVRTKRFRPDFFNPMEEQVTRRKPKESSDKGGDKAKRRRSRAKSNNTAAKEETSKQAPPTPDDDLFSNLSAEKALQYSVILAELNRKLTTQHFRPL